MAAPSQLARSALCIGDPDAFQSEMIKMINDREFRSAKMKLLVQCNHLHCTKLSVQLVIVSMIILQ